MLFKRAATEEFSTYDDLVIDVISTNRTKRALAKRVKEEMELHSENRPDPEPEI